MKRDCFAFTDIVSGNSVFYYVDCYGANWIAEGRSLTSMRMMVKR
jgi:hypothetical protein